MNNIYYIKVCGSADYIRRLNREIRRNYNIYFPSFECRGKNGVVSVLWEVETRNIDRLLAALIHAEKTHIFHAHDNGTKNHWSIW